MIDFYPATESVIYATTGDETKETDGAQAAIISVPAKAVTVGTTYTCSYDVEFMGNTASFSREVRYFTSLFCVFFSDIVAPLLLLPST